MKGLGKGRSLQTYQNKVRKLKKFYNKLFKSSQKKKKERKKLLPKNNEPQKKYFCDKYPTEVSFLDKIKVKQPNPKK